DSTTAADASPGGRAAGTDFDPRGGVREAGGGFGLYRTDSRVSTVARIPERIGSAQTEAFTNAGRHRAARTDVVVLQAAGTARPCRRTRTRVSSAAGIGPFQRLRRRGMDAARELAAETWQRNAARNPG